MSLLAGTSTCMSMRPNSRPEILAWYSWAYLGGRPRMVSWSSPPTSNQVRSRSPEMDWMTMSLEARNLAYNNVAHVGSDFAVKKTESWAAASNALREERPKHLDLAYALGERTK